MLIFQLAHSKQQMIFYNPAVELQQLIHHSTAKANKAKD